MLLLFMICVHTWLLVVNGAAAAFYCSTPYRTELKLREGTAHGDEYVRMISTCMRFENDLPSSSQFSQCEVVVSNHAASRQSETTIGTPSSLQPSTARQSTTSSSSSLTTSSSRVDVGDGRDCEAVTMYQV